MFLTVRMLLFIGKCTCLLFDGSGVCWFGMGAHNRTSQRGRGEDCFSSVDLIWHWKILEILEKEGTGNERNHNVASMGD